MTLLASITVDGQYRPPLFVFKTKDSPYRNVVLNGEVRTETYASYLPHDAHIATRDYVGGIDSANFSAGSMS